ncbi:hypothetical protein [Bradyrhizobium sp. CCBAU 51627]|uniref:hypothetical protein n=1 Tax=Bradyrhizobium sp. CCBAU 51627 TaxID=1325088 RepID=UPI00230621ED|nr:hypothetical protein [Bradyrhizobium sp. CCBAU 51627]MDA9434412.1 hypothetical protein [Bradyrhizobium sp. CCBAU 51627]
MSTSKLVILAAAVAAAISCSGATHAHACSVTEIDSRGDGHLVDLDNRGCNTNRVVQRRENNTAEIRTRGTGNDTNLTQIGSNQGVRISVNGGGNQTHVFTGHCPPGSRPQTINVEGIGQTGVYVPACR